MRERLGSDARRDGMGRITPARAGKTSALIYRRSRCWDHPRSCGKDFFNHLLFVRQLGSPPLVRERPDFQRRLTDPERITPARAGKTDCEAMAPYSSRDHPRSCGKDDMALSDINPDLGSPPLVRERRDEIIQNHLLDRITPARAGKTFRWGLDTAKTQDHPRSCGKDSVNVSGNPTKRGSPPLVRERRPTRRRKETCLRITPARAGKTHSIR